MPSHRIHTIHGTFTDAGNSSRSLNHGGQLFDLPRHQFNNSSRGGYRGSRTQAPNHYTSAAPMNSNAGPRKRNNHRTPPRSSVPNATRRAPPPPPARTIPAQQTYKENFSLNEPATKLVREEKLVYQTSPFSDSNAALPDPPPVISRTQIASPIELEANEITPVPYVQVRTVTYRTGVEQFIREELERQRAHRQRIVATVLLTRSYGRPLGYRAHWPGTQKEYVKSCLSKIVEVDA